MSELKPTEKPEKAPPPVIDRDPSDPTLDFAAAGETDLPPSITPLEPLQRYALLGVEPAHGPFTGGKVAVLRGNGFSSEVRVWFGGVEVPSEQVIATRADRVQVTVPPGAPGSATVTTQNGSDAESLRSLDNGYNYDAFFATPALGPTSGGTTITLTGMGTDWNDDTRVSIDQQDCAVLAVRDIDATTQELDCTLPAGTEGQKSIQVSNNGVTAGVLDAFDYQPGVAPVGGFYGEPLSDRLSVLVTDQAGQPIPGAHVIVGAEYELSTLNQPGSSIRSTDSAGAATFDGTLGPTQTVTVAARCHHPQSFINVPVDTLRVELSATQSPECADQRPLQFGGAPSPPVTVTGELVWRGGVEFQRSGWTNVPVAQNADERRVAYVMQPSGDPESSFRLPRERDAVTVESSGLAGYEFEVVTGAGTRDYYALAGIENRSVSPPRFTTYAMGLVRGIRGNPGETVGDLAIAMNRTLDQPLVFDVAGPVPGSRGPDRIDLRVSVEMAPGAYAIFPNTQVDVPLPAVAAVSIVGLPALVGNLEGARYVVGARAVTGPLGGTPYSTLPLIETNNSAAQVPVRGFAPVPNITVGSDDSIRWNNSLSVSWVDDGVPVDLALYTIQSGSGLVTWSVAAPPDVSAFTLPDLTALPDGGLLPGALDLVVALAGIADFSYAELRSRHLRRFAWNAYAVDVASTRYDP
jgi:hypothetical protein